MIKYMTCKSFLSLEEALKFKDELKNEGVSSRVYYMIYHYTVFYPLVPTSETDDHKINA